MQKRNYHPSKNKFLHNNLLKIIKYIPLLAFMIPAVICSVFLIPRNLWMILGFTSFLLGFVITYLSMVSEILKNSDAMLKIGEKSPVFLPIIFFLVPNIILSIIFILRQLDIVLQFCSCLIGCILTYLSGAVILILELNLYREKITASSFSIGMLGRKRLILINPVNPSKAGLSINHSSVFPPLGLGIIAALTPSDYDVVLIDENMEPFRFEKGDLVGITAFTSAANRAYEIAALYRKNNIPVIMGGIHASMVPDEALRFVDSVVTGEAESVWKTVIDDFEKGNLKRLYKGEQSDLISTIVPRRDIFSRQYLFATVQTSRGCPMDCYFCSVTPFNGGKYRQRLVEDVLDELEKIPQRYIFFVDDNILGYGKEAEERAIRLFQGMVKRRMDKSWFCQATLNFGSNEEVLYWAAKSGCRMVFIGLESADPEELKSMHKNLNLQLEYKKAFRSIHKYGIAVLGAFIFGSDEENKQSMIRKTNYMLQSSIDVIQTTILTPFPGTRLYRQYKDEQRLKYQNIPADWDKFDMTEMTYKMKKMEEQNFLLTLAKCYKRIYSNWTLLRKFFHTWLATKNMETAFWAYYSNRGYQNVGSKLYHIKQDIAG